eukprot:CAMPEP_0201639098 /NCGR_PEP_ID=MMETSP0493-20130528/18397_1 /ASSEMBLY_ACC=CAM_ASM_000838 /TAXON_ID=420259 /ORGANISM="Thalassiosira gravida, Strain GMp14c1" /LENGTH=401 /DNA_ID=CAMNT_0048112383 /DNA_START=121 /DNA_END=1326 /DNA_ORIENTATION=-
MMVPPTTSQQMGAAYAPMPFAIISFLSSSYIIYHLLFQERQKLKRLYHRLVLAMNFALLPLAFVNVWTTLPAPVGTPNVVGAMGTVSTCTSQGILRMTLSFAVATYYASLILQAFVGMRNNFKEQNYRWIEKYIHFVAYSIPCMYAIVFAATDNFNPSGSGCWYAKAPWGCETDPEVACQRGRDIKYFAFVVWFTNICLYVIFPTSVVFAMGCWMKKTRKESASSGSGMTIMREKARKEMMHKVHSQISVYLFSFWATWILTMISTLYQVLTGDLIYDLFIVSHCVFVSQGFVFMVVYFTLQKMGERPAGDNIQSDDAPGQLTVSDIRSNAQRSTENQLGAAWQKFAVSIFDGDSDPDSPWVRFFNGDGSGDEENAPDGGVLDVIKSNGGIELADDQHGIE